MNNRKNHEDKKNHHSERILIRNAIKRMFKEDNKHLNAAIYQKDEKFLFFSLNEIVPMFLKMVRDTMIFEQRVAKIEYITYHKIFPLLKEAKEILYNYYCNFLYFKIDLDKNYYLKLLVSCFE
ncbi:hypothetical protein CWI38_0002p0030 [Hamiltosporidium tvaerminnensis]|uniref:Uncharacterized protein n=2 Tax=Hamiltosporidium TaxID=1176354 RepID=A0A4Q9LEZ5_9MICR|nr:hypothetical protein CWI37_0004p0020 [Hamiltosporidium tvaerminnensis]TBU06055.1 hypothetical protein CWI36_0524p0020 [Hamiltosporidium magnivora]TBU09952.1 hypothetical protein CWI39_0012p0020 [Hamiltosporidium magnivora]TBU21019.1 hypothetical protein CWI38_0002p0030 [Hamiltosporidium tvaerminnensis]